MDTHSALTTNHLHSVTAPPTPLSLRRAPTVSCCLLTSPNPWLWTILEASPGRMWSLKVSTYRWPLLRIWWLNILRMIMMEMWLFVRWAIFEFYYSCKKENLGCFFWQSAAVFSAVSLEWNEKIGWLLLLAIWRLPSSAF